MGRACSCVTYFKNQNDLEEALKELIDRYWAMKLNEDDFIAYLRQVSKNNEELLYTNNGYTTVVKQKLVIKRLGLLSKILYDN